ncbi:hypothetical protein ACEPPN_018932 [Leptodophora sp. 'Broadleaf-Isolate-01']
MEANQWFAPSPTDSAMLLRVSVDGRSSHLYLMNTSTKTMETTSSSTHASPGSKEEKEKEERKGETIHLSHSDSGIGCSFDLDLNPDLEMADSASASASAATLAIPCTPSTSSSVSLALAVAVAYLPLEEQKATYRMPYAELVATNNIHAFPPHPVNPSTQYPYDRVTGVCDNLEFAQCWNTTLSEPILKYLADLPHTWLLDVLRSGYAGD